MSSAWDQAYNQAIGRVDDTTPAPGPDQSEQQPTPAAQPKPGHSHDRKAIAEDADQQAGGEQPMGVGDYALDAATGVAAGVEGFGKSIGKLANDLSGAVGLGKFADDETFESSIHTKTWLGGLTSGMTQFALSFVPALGVAGRLGAAVGITSKLVQGLAAGAAADFVGFSEKQERLSNLIEQFPSLKNPVTDFLSSKQDDNFAEGRLKNALEGLGLGLVMHPVMEALKGFKGMAIAKAAGDQSAYGKAATEAQAKVAEAAGKIAKSAPADADAAAAASTKGAAGYAADRGFDGVGDKIVDYIKANPDKPFEVALDEGLKTHINYEQIGGGKAMEGLQKLAQNVSDKLISNLTSTPMKLQAVAATAEEAAEAYGANPKAFMSAIASDEKAVGGMAQRLVTYRIMRNTVGQAVVDSANKWLADGTEEAASKLTTLAREYGKIHKSVQFIQTEGARIPSFGRVFAWTADNFDPDKLSQIVDKVMGAPGAKGKAAAQQLARTIVASQGNGDPNSLVGLFDSLLKRGGGKAVGVLNELHTNSILSSLTTPSTKLVSDTMNAVVLPAERILGGAWEGNKAVMQSGFRMYQNVLEGMFDWMHLSSGANQISDKFGSSVSRAYQAFKQGSPLLDHLSEFDQHAAITPENFGVKSGTFMGSAVKWIGETVRLPQKMLVGMDEFWKSVNYKAYVRDEAYRLAETAGIKDPAEWDTFVRNHIEQAFTPEGQAANKAALDYAKTATFQNDLLPGTMGKWVQEGVNQHPMMRMIMPFVKTPTNIFRRAWQMTPGLNMLQSEYRQMVMNADPIVRSQAYGRMAVGGMTWTTAIGLANAGRLTGGGPSNPQEAQLQKDSGWQPYSLVLKQADGSKQYISLKKLEPFAYMLGLAADWSAAHGQMKDEDGDKIATGMMYAMAQHLSSKSYYNGLVELVNALSQPDHRVQQYLNNFAGSWVPSIVAKSDDDPYMREAKTMMDAVTRRLPGFSQDMSPVRNVLGEPVKTPAGYLPFGAAGSDAARMVSPFAFSKQLPDPVHQELANLQYPFAKAPRNYQGMDLTMFHNPQSGQDAYDRFQELHGTVQLGGRNLSESLSRLIQSERYQQMPTPDRHGDETNGRVMAVRQVIDSYRQKAMAQTLHEYPQVGNALKSYQMQARAATNPNGPLPMLNVK